MAAPERLASIDVLRGFALLGILTMNITLALPGANHLNPTIAGGFTGVHFAAWLAGFLLFDEKMITLFSMLFGAGLVLMTGRMESRGGPSAVLFYRRSGVLLLFGLTPTCFGKATFWSPMLYAECCFTLCGANLRAR